MDTSLLNGVGRGRGLRAHSRLPSTGPMNEREGRVVFVVWHVILKHNVYGENNQSRDRKFPANFTCAVFRLPRDFLFYATWVSFYTDRIIKDKRPRR